MARCLGPCTICLLLCSILLISGIIYGIYWIVAFSVGVKQNVDAVINTAIKASGAAVDTVHVKGKEMIKAVETKIAQNEEVQEKISDLRSFGEYVNSIHVILSLSEEETGTTQEE